MNPYVIVGLLVGWGASLAGAFWFGTDYEEGRVAEEKLLEDRIADKVRTANQGFSDAMGTRMEATFKGIRIVNTTVQNEVRHEREVHTRVLDNPDCGVPVSTIGLLNRARGFGPIGPRPGESALGVSAPGGVAQ